MKVINLVTNAHQRPSSKICAILKNSFMFGAIQCGKGGISHYLSNFLLPILETWTDSLHFCWVVCEINALNILLVQNFRNSLSWTLSLGCRRLGYIWSYILSTKKQFPKHSPKMSIISTYSCIKYFISRGSFTNKKWQY